MRPLRLTPDGRASPNTYPALTIPAVREIHGVVIKSTRPAGRRAPTAVSAGAANSLVLFTAMVAAVTLSGAGLGMGRGLAAAAGNAASPGRALIGHRAAPAAAPATAAAATPSPALAAAPVSSPELEAALPQLAPGSEATPTPLPLATPGPGFRLRVPIFEYHRVKPPAGETGYVLDLIVPPWLFEGQMQAMAAAGWHTITMAELGDDLRRGIEPAAKSFVVTFDDGYEDGYTDAFPILRRLGFVATYFVIGGRIGDPGQLTVGEMKELVAAGNEIGNHTLTHADLRVLSPENVVNEIYTTCALIATDVGVWPRSFSYPKGLTDTAVTSIVAATPDLETAVIQTGSQPETWPNRLNLPRIRIGPGSYPQYLVYKADRYTQ